MNRIHIAIPSDDKYWLYAAVTAYSAVRDASVPVTIHIVEAGITKEHQETFRRLLPGTEIRFHHFETEGWSIWHGSPVAWSRLFLAELLPELDWVLSADADIMFLGDVAELWNLRDDRLSIQASRDCPLPGTPYTLSHIDWYRANRMEFKDPYGYFCDGLCLCNLKKWRACDVQSRFVELAKKYSDWPSPDQMIINYVLQDNKGLLPRGWGVFSGDENADIDWRKPCAVHFVEDTPWRRWKVTHLASDLCEIWWKRFSELLKGEKVCDGYRGCRSYAEWAIRRFIFVSLKHNQWILKLNWRLWLHLRSTRGVRI